MSRDRQLCIDDFGQDGFEADSFIMGLLSSQIEKWQGGKGKAFDPSEMLGILKERQKDVGELRIEANAAFQEARENAKRLGAHHRKSVAQVRSEAEGALREVRHLEEKIATVGSQAVTIGQRIDKVDRQRRRAKEAERCIQVYDGLRSEDETQRSAAMVSLIPDAATMHTLQEEGNDDDDDEEEGRGRASRRPSVAQTGARLMESASMLRKVDGMLHALKIDGHERASESFAVVNERFEVSLLAEFDQAKARWDAEVSEESLEGMRVCASSLFSFNGGASCIQRYVSLLPFCIDVALMARDDQGISRCTDVGAAVSEISRVLDEVARLFEEEKESITLIFPATGRVMGAVVQRAMNQRVQRFIDSALEELEDCEGQGAWMDCVEVAYGRVHSLLLELSTSSTDLGEVDLVKLLHDVMGEHVTSFIDCSFTTLSSLLSSVLPPSPADPSLTASLFGTPPPPPSPRGRMNLIEQATDIGEKCVKGLMVVTRSIPTSPADGCSEVLRVLDQVVTSVTAHVLSHVSAAKHGCKKLNEASLSTVPAEVKIAVYAVVCVQRFAESVVSPVTRHDVKQATEGSTKVWDMSVKIEASLSDLLSSYLAYAKSHLTSRLAALQKKTDFLPKSDDYVAVEPTKACTDCTEWIMSMRNAWLEHGPPSLYSPTGEDSATNAAGDANSRALLSGLGRVCVESVIDHIRGYTFSPVGGLQVMRDLQSWKALAGSLNSPDSERRFEEYREAANVVIIEPRDLVAFLEDGGDYNRYNSSARSDLLELRSDWKVLKDKYNLSTGGEGGGGVGKPAVKSPRAPGKR